MNRRQVTVVAALMTPVDNEGELELSSLHTLLDFVLERGVDGVVVGGATGEYESFDLDQRKQVIRETRKHQGGRFPVLAGIGCQTVAATLNLGRFAAKEGSDGVLVSMPSYFRYREDDLAEYCSTVSRKLGVPSYLYHLPAFTNSMPVDELARVLVSESSLAGIKDSSGDVRNLSILAQARQRRGFKVLVGNDSRVLDALSAGWDGAISGLSCFVPELLVELRKGFVAGDRERAERAQAALNELIEQVEKLPIPWAIRLGLEVRGLNPGPLPLPLSPKRRQEVLAYREWCHDWLQRQTWTQPLAAMSA